MVVLFCIKHDLHYLCSQYRAYALLVYYLEKKRNALLDGENVGSLLALLNSLILNVLQSIFWSVLFLCSYFHLANINPFFECTATFESINFY